MSPLRFLPSLRTCVWEQRGGLAITAAVPRTRSRSHQAEAWHYTLTMTMLHARPHSNLHRLHDHRWAASRADRDFPPHHGAAHERAAGAAQRDRARPHRVLARAHELSRDWLGGIQSKAGVGTERRRRCSCGAGRALRRGSGSMSGMRGGYVGGYTWTMHCTVTNGSREEHVTSHPSLRAT